MNNILTLTTDTIFVLIDKKRTINNKDVERAIKNKEAKRQSSIFNQRDSIGRSVISKEVGEELVSDTRAGSKIDNRIKNVETNDNLSKNLETDHYMFTTEIDSEKCEQLDLEKENESQSDKEESFEYDKEERDDNDKEERDNNDKEEGLENVKEEAIRTSKKKKSDGWEF